jgi:hypothetical protein
MFGSPLKLMGRSPDSSSMILSDAWGRADPLRAEVLAFPTLKAEPPPASAKKSVVAITGWRAYGSGIGVILN